MTRIAGSAAIGIAAGGALAAAYYLLPRAGIHLDPPTLMVGAALFAFAASTSAFALIAMNRPAGAGKVSVVSPLNEFPAAGFVEKFKGAGTVQILARPGVPLSEILVRFGNLFKEPEKNADKSIVVTLKASKKDVFNPIVLKQLFETLKPFEGFCHVLLMGEADEFVGYIPADRAKKDFTGENAETKISKCIVEVFAAPKESTRLRAMKGCAQDDTISEDADIRDAAKKMWMDDAVQGLVVYKHLRPFGFIGKIGILSLMSKGA